MNEPSEQVSQGMFANSLTKKILWNFSELPEIKQLLWNKW